jgi:hypothetical protein
MYRSAPAPRVVWVPTARDELTWFKTYELEAEEVWEKSLLEALRQYGVDISYDHELELVGLLPAHAKEWFDKPKHTWKELTPGNAKGALVDDHRMLQVLAGQDGEFHTLREENRFDIFEFVFLLIIYQFFKVNFFNKIYNIHSFLKVFLSFFNKSLKTFTNKNTKSFAVIFSPSTSSNLKKVSKAI